MFAYLSQTRVQGGLLRRTDKIGKELSNSPSPLSPDNNLLAMHAAEATTEQVWFTHSPVRLSLRSEMWPANTNDSAVTWQSGRLPAFSLQASVSIERHLSRISLSYPRSLASVLIPRPSALRVSAFTAFRKSLCKERKNIFRTFRKRRRLALGSGAHSRRFAQECPEGNPGKYETGEKQWHSTKTKSL
jgi:hypothetical protein